MNKYEWNSWFAWKPVTVGYEEIENMRVTNKGGNGMRWLKWLERRHIGIIAPDGDLSDCWQYRETNLLTDK